MTKTQVVRMTPEAVRVSDALAGDTILALAGLGPLDRSGVVILSCHLLALIAHDLVPRDTGPDVRLVTDAPPVEVLEVYFRLLAHRRRLMPTRVAFASWRRR